MIGKTAGVLINRLVVGFVFAFIYQAMTAMATSALAIPLTGTIQDLIWGLESVDQTQGTLAIVWWIVSTSIFTVIATQLVRFRKRISPYKAESGIDAPHRITIVSLIILGTTMSALFFMLDLVLGATSAVSDIHTIYESVTAGDYGPLAISIIFSMVAGFVVVWVVGRSTRVSEITKGVGSINIDDIRKKMTKTKTTADTLGLAPGALVHVGVKKVDKVWFSIIRYDQDDYEEISKTHDIEQCHKKDDCINWFNVTGVHDAECISWLGEQFDIHELHQADIMNTELRPTMFDDPDNMFVTLKMPRLNEDDNLVIEHISMVLGHDYVISFQEEEGDVFDRVRENIRKSRGKFRNMGSDYLAYTIIDAIVDNFFVIMEKMGTQTEVLERELMSNPEPQTLQTIYTLKRQMITFRRVIWPMREVISGMERSNSPLILDTTKRYLRDVYNHTVQTMDTLESLRDMAGGMLDTYLSSVNNRMSEIMKTLTIIASIFIPITFVAGLYGTNFSNIPELELEGGYFAMLAAMGAISTTMLIWFRRKSWL